MRRLPDHQEQIRLTHAGFICQVVATCGNPDRRNELDLLLRTAEEGGWVTLAGAIRRIIAGERDLSRCPGLDEEDQVIAEAILQGLQDPTTLPDPKRGAEPAMAAPGLAHMIHAASRGNVEALVLIGNMAEQMSLVGGSMARLASLIRPLINGERDASRLCQGMDPRTEQLVVDILLELDKLNSH